MMSIYSRCEISDRPFGLTFRGRGYKTLFFHAQLNYTKVRLSLKVTGYNRGRKKTWLRVSDTNRAVQPQKIARGLKFRI